jgi:Zn-dependent M16 (insulinase) family peptidase
LNDARVEHQKLTFEPVAKNEGLTTSGKVQFAAKAYNFIKLGYKYTGSMQVLRTIVRFDYLWNRVRVQGGAYGCSASFTRGGNSYFTSYRDPNLSETLKAYDETEKYLKQFNADEREMTKYIIGTISEVDAPLTPSMKGQRSDFNYFSGISGQDLQKERDEILSTKVDDIRNFAQLVADVMKQNYICVLGNEETIKQNKSIFKDIVKVFE